MTFLYHNVYFVQIIGLFGSVKVINGPLDQVHFVQINIHIYVFQFFIWVLHHLHMHILYCMCICTYVRSIHLYVYTICSYGTDHGKGNVNRLKR